MRTAAAASISPLAESSGRCNRTHDWLIWLSPYSIVAEAASLPVLNPGDALTAEFFNGYNYLLDRRKRQDVTMEFKHMTVRLANEEAQANYRRTPRTKLP